MGNVTSTQKMFASSEDSPRFDLARMEKSVDRIVHRAVTPLDRCRLLRNAQSVIEALYDRRSLRIIAARCEPLIFAAAILVKKVEAKGADGQ